MNAGEQARCAFWLASPVAAVAVVAGLLTVPAIGSYGAAPDLEGGLLGFKGDRLKGSISCIHPNMLFDLLGRISDQPDYIHVVRIYIGQGHCREADIPTTLVRPLAEKTFKTWDGYNAEAWETVLEMIKADGTSDSVNAYSIVFPKEMERTYSD